MTDKRQCLQLVDSIQVSISQEFSGMFFFPFFLIFISAFSLHFPPSRETTQTASLISTMWQRNSKAAIFLINEINPEWINLRREENIYVWRSSWESAGNKKKLINKNIHCNCLRIFIRPRKLRCVFVCHVTVIAFFSLFHLFFFISHPSVPLCNALKRKIKAEK